MYNYEADYVRLEVGDETFAFPIRDPHEREVLRWYERNVDIIVEIENDPENVEINADVIEFVIRTVKKFTFVPDQVVDSLTMAELFNACNDTVESITPNSE